MKKIKKFLAVLSSAIFISSIGFMSVSAGTTETIFMRENGCVSNFHKNYPVKQIVDTYYKGILVTMPDNEVPTAEKLGIDANCEISLYNNENDFIGLGGDWKDGLYYGGSISVPTGDNTTYFISGDDIPEEEAAALIKTLKVRNVISNGEMFYETFTNTFEMYAIYDTVDVYVDCKNDVDDTKVSHAPTEEDHDLYGFEEITEHGFEIESLSVRNNNYSSGSWIIYSVKFDHDTYTSNIWGLYVELCSIFDEIKANNADDENFEDIDIGWIAPISENRGNGLYSVEPTWGDATNDDKIDLNDAIEIAKYIMGSSDIDEDTVLLADINRDGKTDIYDVIEIAKTLLS